MTQPSTRGRPQGPAGSIRRSAGFTLIELMIAVAIIGILASIAYPSYQRYVERALRADAHAGLMEAAGIMERCYTQFNRYNDSECSLVGSNILSPDGEYTITVSFPDPPGGQGYLVSSSVSSRDGCTENNGVMTLNHLGERNPSACWD
ncbi:type IV pilin protein [Halomonas mongoliensis]|uniref:type IV pilin protein n=1 Tax=Halomonas mongoliensis TaxID=321265 RepID=UPI00403AC0DF